MPIGSATGRLVASLLLQFSLASAIAEAAKCCENGLVLDDGFRECVTPESGQELLLLLGEERIEEAERDIVDEYEVGRENQSLLANYSCFQVSEESWTNSSKDDEELVSCKDYHKNGSLIHLECFNASRKLVDRKCDSVLAQVHIYGASMLIFANIVFVVMYTTVIMLYALVPKLCRRAYDKAVLSFVITQDILSIDIIAVGHYILCHKPLSELSYSLYGIGMMIFTISGCLWLLVMSVELASTITSLRWAPSSGNKGQDENRKFWIYFTWVTLGTLVPVTTSTILQFSPLPDDYFAKPNFHIMLGVNYRVVAHVITVPVLVAVASNVLFAYTTLKMISIKKSSNMAHENRKKGVKDKYILYLKLYLLMDAPYVTGALAAIFENLWLLKFVRLSQPVLMMYAVLPRDMLMNMLPWKKKAKNNNQGQAQLKRAIKTVA